MSPTFHTVSTTKSLKHFLIIKSARTWRYLPTWANGLRFIPFVVATILILSIVVLGLGAGYGSQLAKASLDSYKLAHPSEYPGIHYRYTAYFVFYSATLPFLSILHATLDLGLYIGGRLPSIYALAGSLVLLCGWGVQVGFWTQCDLQASRETGAPGQCYQFYIQQDPKNGKLVGVSESLANAKVGFGWLVLIKYVVYVGFAAAAVHKQRVRSKHPMNDVKELDSKRESSQI